MAHRAISAKTTYPNSQETDRQLRVWHTVLVEFDGNKRISYLHFSADPMSAIREINEMSEEEVKQLEHGA